MMLIVMMIVILYSMEDPVSLRCQFIAFPSFLLAQIFSCDDDDDALDDDSDDDDDNWLPSLLGWHDISRSPCYSKTICILGKVDTELTPTKISLLVAS